MKLFHEFNLNCIFELFEENTILILNTSLKSRNFKGYIWV